MFRLRLQSATVLVIDNVAGLGEVLSSLLHQLLHIGYNLLSFRLALSPSARVLYMSFGFFLCTEIISIVHAIQSDELANIPDIGLQHVFHTVHLLYLVYGPYSAAAWRVLY